MNTTTNVCEDTDECATNPCTLGNEKCINNIGAIQTCDCKDGFKRNMTSYACDDVDECLTNPCHAQADCTNLPGSHKCVCKDGWIGDGVKKCDVDGGFHMECNKDNTLTVTIPYTRAADVTFLEYGTCDKSSDGVTIEAQYTDHTYVIHLDVAKCNSAGTVASLKYDQDATIRLGRGNIMFSEFVVDSHCEYNGEYTIKFDYGTLATVDTQYSAGAGLVNLSFAMEAYNKSWGGVIPKGPSKAGDQIWLGLKVNGIHKMSSSKQFAPVSCGVLEDGSSTIAYTLFDTSVSCANNDIDLEVYYHDASKTWRITHTLFLLGSKTNSKYSLQCDVLVCDKNQKNEENKCQPIHDKCS
jgi:hypothetical protein